MYSLLPGSPVCEYLLAVVDGHQFLVLCDVELYCEEVVGPIHF